MQRRIRKKKTRMGTFEVSIGNQIVGTAFTEREANKVMVILRKLRKKKKK